MAVLGGTGFIGRPFVQALREDGRELRLLVRGASRTAAAPVSSQAMRSAAAAASTQATTSEPASATIPGADHRVDPDAREDLAGRSPADRGVASDGAAAPPNVEVPGDLDDRASLARLVVPGCSVVNLAWAGVAAERAVSQARALADVCVERQARLLIHCSSVGVMAGCDGARLDDDTPARARDAYGSAKLAGEEALRAALAGRVPLVIVRPTSVFGPGGRGLIRLADSLTHGRRVANYLRSCLFDRRALHLVPVETVVMALRFLEAREHTGAEVYLVSADDESPNRFRDVEARLMSGLRVSDYRCPRLPLPPALLRLALGAAGKRSSLPFTVVEARRLRALGFRPPVTMESALATFARWFHEQPHDASR